ncbi:MAG: hypothetical protein IK125_07930 [Lachnospiraceae bacterium]|nr:hypothetical protein [Lachnospiraceae bacterium]
MEEAKKKLGKVRVTIVWIEMGILFLIGVISLLNTMDVVKMDYNYHWDYLYGLVGLAFILALYLLAQYGIKWVWVIGIPMIAGFALLVWVTYWPAYDRARGVERYQDLVEKEFTVEYNGAIYDWHDHRTVKDEAISTHTTESRVNVVTKLVTEEGEQTEEQIWILYYDPETKCLYSTAATGESKYLMELDKKE